MLTLRNSTVDKQAKKGYVKQEDFDMLCKEVHMTRTRIREIEKRYESLKEEFYALKEAFDYSH